MKQRNNLRKLFLYTAILLTISGKVHAQKKRIIMPIGSFGYFHQSTNNYFVNIGPALMFKRHTYLALMGGADFYRHNDVKYISPNVTLEYFYQFNTKKVGLGPVFSVNYTPYKINGLRDQYISMDVGFLIQGLTIFGGYNYSLDKKDLNQIAPFRVGVKFP